ncbi:hypothetical protein ZOSMA_120G00530 [Zostera marina]|uniref:Uncharacterized protein n=1 Tax=Zostera marina TaxID=29655 RepID=A0A0K9Q3B5_ZOSMR|nr:hypothetical protein ZOSMA_120G00530 [Zostera marina]
MQRSGRTNLGRPTGTDGSDYNYRMVVDSRYTKVAKGKSRLRLLIAAQAVCQVIGTLLTILSGWKEKKSIDRIAILWIVIGFFSIIIGELGRRRSIVTLLRLYNTSSAMATALSIGCVIRMNFFHQVIETLDISSMKNNEIVEVCRVFFGFLLELVIIFTNVGLVHNMSLKR